MSTDAQTTRKPNESASNSEGSAFSLARLALLFGGAKLLVVAAIVTLVLAFVLAILGMSVGATTGSGQTLIYGVSRFALKDIPPRYLALYQQAARKGGIDWAIVAAIGKIETDHGRLNAPGVRSGVNSFGCCAGPMQFYVAGANSTWDAYGVDGDGDGKRNVYDPADAIPAAVKYLKASGAPGDYRKAIFAYNHADWYVNQVLAMADRYRGSLRTIGGGRPPPIAGNGKLLWPVRGPITSPFCERRSWESCHPGIDIGVPSGTPIKAAAPGKVMSRGPAGGYGNLTCVQHAPRLTTCYAHQSAFKVRYGQFVQAGHVIGLVGCTGLCFGAHLHFEVRLGGPSGQVTNPMNYLGRR